MPNLNYRTGARLERLWMQQMRRKGYRVMRSAGSKGLIDCMAWNEKEIIMAQIKANQYAHHNDELEKLRRMPRPPQARVVLYERVGAGMIEWKEIVC